MNKFNNIRNKRKNNKYYQMKPNRKSKTKNSNQKNKRRNSLSLRVQFIENPLTPNRYGIIVYNIKTCALKAN